MIKQFFHKGQKIIIGDGSFVHKPGELLEQHPFINESESNYSDLLGESIKGKQAIVVKEPYIDFYLLEGIKHNDTFIDVKMVDTNEVYTVIASYYSAHYRNQQEIEDAKAFQDWADEYSDSEPDYPF